MAHVVVGLGNPGPKYRGTRHNVGQRVLDRLAQDLGVVWRESGPALVARGRWRDHAVDLVKPQSFMNVSGPPVAATLRLVLIYLGAKLRDEDPFPQLEQELEVPHPAPPAATRAVGRRAHS